MSLDPDPEVVGALAANPILEPQRLKQLARSKEAVVRAGVARNPSIPDTVRAKLGKDRDYDVIFALMGNRPGEPAGPEPRIPEVSSGELGYLVKKIKPLVKKQGKLSFIAPVHPRDTAFNWSPTFTGPAPKLTKVADITTYHEFAAPAFFKPSLAEVLAQIPVGLRKEVDAFAIMGGVEVVGSYHRATIRLYRFKQVMAPGLI